MVSMGLEQYGTNVECRVPTLVFFSSSDYKYSYEEICVSHLSFVIYPVPPPIVHIVECDKIFKKIIHVGR